MQARDKRIKRVGKGEFRSKLSVEDILPGVLDETYSIHNRFSKYENILVMAKAPLLYPFMDYAFHIKIKSLDDKYLKRFVADLSYLNEGIDEEGMKKMTTFIVKNFVFFNTLIKRPCLSFEKVFPKVVELIAIAELNGYECNADRLVVFSQNTLLEKEDRQKISFETRSYRNTYLHEEVIHNKAMTLVSKYPSFAVGRREVHNEVSDRKGLKTFRSFNKHIAEKTVKVLDEALELRKFRSAKEVQEFEKYRQWRSEGINTADIVIELGVSYSTVAKYSRILKEVEQREIL